MKEVLDAQPVADLRALEKDEFWTFLDNRGWMHPFDAEGVRQPRDVSFRRPLRISKTIPIAALPASCGSPAATRRTRLLSANSCGPMRLRRRVEQDMVARDDIAGADAVAHRLSRKSGVSVLPPWPVWAA